MNYALILIGLSLLPQITLAKSLNSRRPAQAESFNPQVQFCEGSLALGNEGQGMGAGAFINVFAATDPQTNANIKKCELAMAVAYEYGNSKGFRIGRMTPYQLSQIPTGKTDCAILEKDGEMLLTLTKSNNSRRGRPVVLVEQCKLTEQGF